MWTVIAGEWHDRAVPRDDRVQDVLVVDDHGSELVIVDVEALVPRSSQAAGVALADPTSARVSASRSDGHAHIQAVREVCSVVSRSVPRMILLCANVNECRIAKHAHA